MLAKESDLYICEQVAASLYSETNYVKQHENSQGANADRETHRERDTQREREGSKFATCYKSNRDSSF